MDFLISVAGKIAEYAIEPVGRQFGYLFYYNSNIETFKAKVQKLENDRLRTADSVVAAERNGESVFLDVKEWLRSVDQIREESTEFLNNQVKENQKCFSRQLPCPDLVSRYRVSRKSSKKSLQVDELLNDGIKFDKKVSTPAPPPSASSMFAGDIEAFDSRKVTFEAIMKALEDDEVNMIGVYGMGGIGKTTMVQHVAKVAEQQQRKLYDELAIAVVSQKPIVHKIQSEIAKMLGLTLDDQENEFVRAGRLVERMKKGKKILLVLDDLWDRIDLTKIGIPRKCCKIILTSRDLNVCNKMKCERFIPIEVLSHTDALSYFRVNAGDAVDSPDLRPIATKIVEKCAGLPIAIKTIGLALTGKRQHDWEDALEQLRNSTAQNIEGVHQDVYDVLEVSYNLLDSDDLRYCFLICCLFEEDADISIEKLVRYGLGLNLFQTRNRAHVLVDKLKDRSLLMKGKTDNSVIMHDVIREFAHFLASSSREHVFLVRQGVDITEWPDRDACSHYTAISLLSHQISELPEGLDCPKLKILIFEPIYTSEKLKIPSNFFQGMKHLRVLKMLYCSMPSIALLKDLETLCLEFCTLGDLSQIGGLKKLKVLSLARSDFEELPREIGLLTNLMILDLTECNALNVVPPNLISSLTKLECLYVRNRYNQWGWGGSNATVGELKHLHHLNTLEMHVSDISLLPSDLPFQNLIRFRVCLGIHKQEYLNIRWDLEKVLVIILEPHHNSTLPDGVKTLMKRAQALIVEFKGYNYPAKEYPHPSALSDLNEDGFKTLKYLEVNKNYSMKYLVDSSNASTATRSFFPLLEILRLEKLGLNEICGDDLPDGSFGELRKLELSYLPNLTKLWSMNISARYPRLVNLRSVQISDCKELKHVFPQSALAFLGQLESLTVMDCKSLEGILLEDRTETGDVIQLPKLQSLQIHRVPSLTSFCFQKNKAHAGQLFDTKILLPALEKLVFIGLDWLSQLLLESSCKLREITISNCKSIVTVFSSNVLHCLQNLAYLSIQYCESLEAILEVDDTLTAMLPQLQQQHHHLDRLSQPELPREFPSLKTIYISNCPKLKAFAVAASSMVDYKMSDINVVDLIPPFFDEMVAFPALEELILKDVHMPTEIWHPRLLPVNSFCSLTEVEIVACGSLITIFPSNLLPRLLRLSKIKLESCDLLERVFDVDGTHKVALPSLTKLYLSCLRPRSFFCEKIVFPAIEKLDLRGLHDVKEIWHPRLFSKESFHRLKSVRLDKCNSMVTIFPCCVLRRLKNLDSIWISNCELVEEVFGFDDEDAATFTVLMIPLREITLVDLPNLMRFGHGTAGFPSLKEMYIQDCPKMKTFMAAHERNLGGDFIRPFFHEKVELPVLVELDIRGLQDVEELWSQAGSYGELRNLRVEMCTKLLKVIPLRLLLTMKKLKMISVEDCESVKEVVKIDCQIVGDEGAVDNAILTRSHLRELYLRKLPKLTNIWWNKDRSGIFSCPDLHSLEVNGCHGLRNIFVPSAIKHDMNIQELMIADCSNMEVVVGEEKQGEYSGDKLQFRLVQKLSLQNLPNLRSFCRGNYILEWSSLSKMVMNDCPNMATFCLGPVSTPQLKGLSQNEDNKEVLREGGDLNDIIQHLFHIQKETAAKEKHEEETTGTQ